MDQERYVLVSFQASDFYLKKQNKSVFILQISSMEQGSIHDINVLTEPRPTPDSEEARWA